MKFAFEALCRELNKLERADLGSVQHWLAHVTAQDINEGFYNGQGVVMLAVMTHRADIVQAVLNTGANPDGNILGGNTPLLQAAGQENADIVDVLIKARADLNLAENRQGMTPMMEAVITGNHAALELLLQAGADMTRTDRDGKNALMHALAQKDVKAVELISDEQSRREARAAFSAAAQKEIPAPEIIICVTKRVIRFTP